ncbi:MAG TPA: MBL fold metallo-hydrolase [Chitinophagaceae bacterium]|jgi:ribonuclease BN (tRNA processing enzyme)|nr:MBL fold metallo-hydrolase [Chitinophagaceae bacterium]
MIVQILGTRGEIEAHTPKHFKHSGILIDNKILIDIGEAEYLKYDPQFILISHFHPDHAFFAKDSKKVKINVPIFAPEATKRISGITITSSPFKKDNYLITPIPTVHSLKVKSQGYIIEKSEKRIFYSSDLITIKEKYHNQLRKLDLVITEGSFIRKGGIVQQYLESGKFYGHAGIPDLVFLFRPFTHRIIFTHFGTWFMKNIPAAKKKIKLLEEKGLSLEIAEDGKKYKV